MIGRKNGLRPSAKCHYLINPTRENQEARLGKIQEVLMATPLDPKQIVSFEELLMSQVAQQEALTRLLVEKGIFTKESFWEL